MLCKILTFRLLRESEHVTSTASPVIVDSLLVFSKVLLHLNIFISKPGKNVVYVYNETNVAI